MNSNLVGCDQEVTQKWKAVILLQMELIYTYFPNTFLDFLHPLLATDVAVAAAVEIVASSGYSCVDTLQRTCLYRNYGSCKLLL
jgi:hypothetical protein